MSLSWPASRFIIMLHNFNLWFKGILKLIFAVDETLLQLLVYVLIINTRKGSRSIFTPLVQCPIVESCFKAFFNYYLIWMYQILACTLFSELEIVFSLGLWCKRKLVQIYAFGSECWSAFYWNMLHGTSFLITDIVPGGNFPFVVWIEKTFHVLNVKVSFWAYQKIQLWKLNAI